MNTECLTKTLNNESPATLLLDDSEQQTQISPRAEGTCTWCGQRFLAPWNNPCISRAEASKCSYYKGR